MTTSRRVFLSCNDCGAVLVNEQGGIPEFTREASARSFAIRMGWERTPPPRRDICPNCLGGSSAPLPVDPEGLTSGTQVEVSYTGRFVVAPDGYSRIVSTGDSELDRWINVLPAHVIIKIKE